eukprot:scaffold14906_cov114-Isochrysis_galbana.AAC.3
MYAQKSNVFPPFPFTLPSLTGELLQRTPELVLRCSTTCYNLEACVVLNGLRHTRRPQWHNGSLTALGGMCLAMWRSKHPTNYDHTSQAHRHTVPGHLPPPVRL